MFEALLSWRAPDSSDRLNRISQYIQPKGVYWGGSVVPDPAHNMTVIINPFVCKSFDGMTVREMTDTYSLTFLTDGEYYVGLLAKYVTYATPVLSVMYISTADYPTYPDKDYFIKFAKVTIPPGHTGVLTPAMIDQSSADARDFPISDWSSRVQVVDAYVDLPATGVDGDIRFVKELQTFYVYYEGAWHRDSPVLSGSDLFSGGGTTITHNLGHTNYDVSITPNADPGGYLGEVYVDKAANWFIVYRSGDALTGFDWVLAIRG